MENLLKFINKPTFIDSEEELTFVNFNKVTRVHDWRNHVPTALIESWSILTDRERRIIRATAEIAADKEEWN